MVQVLERKQAEVANPCIRNCCLDLNDVCCGCKRTLEEILGWHHYTVEQKRTLLLALEKR
jgi:predicted Fe-S protein YdhL (DUF1289 family)